jgi:hypothetical protein
MPAKTRASAAEECGKEIPSHKINFGSPHIIILIAQHFNLLEPKSNAWIAARVLGRIRGQKLSSILAPA